MRRLPVFVGIPRATLEATVGSLPSVTVDEEIGGVQEVHTPVGDLLWRRVVRSFTHPTQDSAAPSGKWSLWCFLPRSADDWRVAGKAYRWLGRRRISHPNQVLGPWTAKALWQLIKNRSTDDGEPFSRFFQVGATLSAPWVLYGDDPISVVVPEYAPNDSDIQNDIEPNEEDIFG